jgi:aryl-alcohol dehydrogenase-like predicted oxidoreductase
MTTTTEAEIAAPKIRTRPLGKTGLDVTELALGTWALSGEAYGPVTDADADQIIDTAVELGINLFDTSSAYAKGAVETRLGKRLSAVKDKTYVVTRVGVDRSGDTARKRFETAFLRDAIDGSIERLDRPMLDVVMLHNPSVGALVRPDLVALMDELVAQKRVRTWGISAGDAEVARVALQIGAPVISMPYNALISHDLHGLLGDVVEQQAGLLVHSVLSYGMLVGIWHEDRTFPEGDHRRDRWTPGELKVRLKQLDALRAMTGGDVHTLRSAALRYVLSNRVLHSAILGPRNAAQLEQLVREAGNGPPYLDDDKLAALPGRLAALGAEP